jgi:hypothetical protein
MMLLKRPEHSSGLFFENYASMTGHRAPADNPGYS